MPSRRTLAIAALAAALTLPAPAATAVPVAMPIPLADTFYAAPANLDTLTPGTVLRSRTMPAPFAVTASITQLEFRSTDSLGRAIPAVTTVLTPPGHRPDSPVLVFAHAINSLGLQCAPSQAMWSSDPNTVMREAPMLDLALAAGWTVVLPDHLGPRSAYGAARLGGQILLDSARAARAWAPLNIANSPIAVAGYSGGGMSAAFAAALAPTYAPELPLAAAALGGVPTNLEAMALAIGHAPHPVFGIPFAVAVGLEREYGDALPISAYLNDTGVRLREALANACINDILARGAGHSVDELSTSTSLFDAAETKAVLRANSVEFEPHSPTVPVFEWHSPIDALLPLDSLDATMARWRAQGTPLTSLAVGSPDHLTAAVLGAPQAMAFLAEQFSHPH